MRAHFLLILFTFFRDTAWAQTPDSVASLPDETYRAEIRAKASIDAKEVPQNRFVTYTIEVNWNGDLDRFEIEKLEPPALTNLEIVSTASSNWVGELDGVQQSIEKYEFQLAPTELGMAYIDGVIVEYRDVVAQKTRRLVTNRLEVEVTAPVLEKDFSTYFVAGAGFLCLLVAAGITFYVIRKRKISEAERERLAESAIPAEEKYLNDLKHSVDLSKADTADGYSSVSKIFKYYLSERYGIRAVEQTTGEITAELQGRAVSENIVEKTREILSACDVAKFSGGSADRAGLERIYTLVEDVLATNKTQFIDEINMG